jgi:hypothetical protein
MNLDIRGPSAHFRMSLPGKTVEGHTWTGDRDERRDRRYQPCGSETTHGAIGVPVSMTPGAPVSDLDALEPEPVAVLLTVGDEELEPLAED